MNGRSLVLITKYWKLWLMFNVHFHVQFSTQISFLIEFDKKIVYLNFVLPLPCYCSNYILDNVLCQMDDHNILEDWWRTWILRRYWSWKLHGHWYLQSLKTRTPGCPDTPAIHTELDWSRVGDYSATQHTHLNYHPEHSMCHLKSNRGQANLDSYYFY